jgi:uncharacterized membrane protein YfcA
VLAAPVFGLAIGLMIGTVGGGGAVLAVPVLVYVVGLGVHEATTASLAIVGAGALVGSVGQARRGSVCWTVATWFAAAAAIGSLAGTLANRALGGPALLLAFSGVMLLAAVATWRRAGRPAAAETGCPGVAGRVVFPAGLLVGALTGLVGVGGGFVVVPALAIGLSVGVREAMGTSTVIVAVVSICGLAAHLAAGTGLNLGVATAMGVTTIAGAALAPRLSRPLSTRTLAHAFSLIVMAVAVGVAASATATITT